METVLPGSSFASGRATAALKVRPTIATELGPLSRAAAAVEWTDGPSQVAELDTLYRRMLRTSEKLRLAIASMEEEGLEEDWSDALATAQRLVFAAQAPDAYWRGQTPGYTDPALRDAVTSRLLEAEGMLDVLVQGEEDWIAMEEEDRDTDLADEVFVANRLISVWVVPERGGSVRTLEDRTTRRNLLDVGGRREEPFFAELAAAPLEVEAGGAPRRGHALRRLSDKLPTTVDNVDRLGIRELLLEPDAAPSELFSGALTGATVARDGVEILENRIDEEGDASYRLRLRQRLELGGVRPRRAAVEKCVRVPIDAAELSLEYAGTVEGEGGALLAVELPLRLGGSGARLSVNDTPHDLTEGALHEVTSLKLENDGGE
jgi:hypothetical protein